MLGADPQRRPKPFVAVSRRHPDVDDHDLRARSAHREQEILRVVASTDDVEAGLLEDVRDAFADEDAVLRDRYAHGIRALTRVPAPSGDETPRLPPSDSTRSARPRSPEP